MATYKEIKGTDVEVVSSDPTNPVVGQVWYNTTTQELKGYKQFIGNAWSSGGSLNTARGSLDGIGTQTATIAFGGYDPSPAITAANESYNGTSWTEVNDLNAPRTEHAVSGTQTAGLTFGGQISGSITPSVTESWNGTSWTNLPATLNTGRRHIGGQGTQTSALAFGGEDPVTTAVTESWNGSAWTEVSDLNTAKQMVEMKCQPPLLKLQF